MAILTQQKMYYQYLAWINVPYRVIFLNPIPLRMAKTPELAVQGEIGLSMPWSEIYTPFGRMVSTAHALIMKTVWDGSTLSRQLWKYSD